jgi:hypothetical protein
LQITAYLKSKWSNSKHIIPKIAYFFCRFRLTMIIEPTFNKRQGGVIPPTDFIRQCGGGAFVTQTGAEE